jgi:Bacterial Ig domain
MTELRRTTVPKAKIGLALLLAALTMLLTACPDPMTELKPEIRLSADKSVITGSGAVTLMVEVLEGKVDSVTFTANKGPAIPPVTSPNSAGDFVQTVTVNETTTFTATATGPGGTTTTPAAEAVTVTVTPSTETPVAPPQTFKTYKEVALLYGVTPTGFSATSPVTVQGIKGDVAAATDQTTKEGGKVSIVAGKDVLAFNYRPAPGFVGSDDFEYTVSLNGKTETGTITVTVADLPVDIFKISTLEDLNSTEANQTVLVTKEIPCSTNPCVRLLEGQTLTGKVTTQEGITLISPTARIVANIPDTRQPGTPSCNPELLPNCLETRVVELADNSSVKNLEISGTGSRYFVAIFGTTYDDGSTRLEGDINVEDVIIKNSNGKPIYLKCQLPACDPNIQYGEYDLTINNVRIESAFDTVVIGSPGKLTFTNSFIELKPPFGDNVGIDIVDTIGASLTLDNVDVFMETTDYILDGNAGTGGKPFIITSNKPGATTTLTVKNCDITYGDSVNLSSVTTFKLQAFNAIMNLTNSTGNISEATNPSIERVVTGTGAINGTLELQ